MSCHRLTNGRRRGARVGLAILALTMTGAVTVLGGQPAAGTWSTAAFSSGDGLQADATWSPDGRFIAYTADRFGNSDLFVQPVAGGDAERVTDHDADDWQPDWSPDSTRLVFRSERLGGGLFIVDIATRRVTRLTPFGYNPKWSPQGDRLLFAAWMTLRDTQPQRMYVIPAVGGVPTQVLAATDVVSRSTIYAWHPGGRASFLHGDGSGKAAVTTLDVIAPTKATTLRTPVAFPPAPTYEGIVGGLAWTRQGDALVYIAGPPATKPRAGELPAAPGGAVWRQPVDPGTLAPVGRPELLAMPPHGALGNPTVSPDGERVAYTSYSRSTRIWAFARNASTGEVTTPGRPVTGDDLVALAPAYSPDGRKLVYAAARRDGPGWRQELREWSEAGDRVLAADETWRYMPNWSPDGARLMYRLDAKSGMSTMTMDMGTLKERRLNAFSMMGAPYGWSPDARSILATMYYLQQSNTFGLGLFLVPVGGGDATNEPRELIAPKGRRVWQGSYSPNGRWLTFISQPPLDVASSLHVAPAAGGQMIYVTHDEGWDDKPRFAPDGRLIYFVSSRGGPFVVAAAPFDAETGRVVGQPAVRLSLSAPRYQIQMQPFWSELAVSADRLAVPVTETLGHIVVASRARK